MFKSVNRGLRTAQKIPKYLQIQNWLYSMIRRERFRPGDQLPTEEDLAHMFDVNRMTVRQAMDHLVFQGMIVRERGKGTFLTNTKPRELVHELDYISSFTEKMRAMGIIPSTKTYKMEVVQADQNTATTLQLGNDWRVIHLWRAKLADQDAVLIEREYLPYREFKDILKMDVSGSLYQMLVKEFGVSLSHATQILSAALASEEDQKIFGISGPVPCVVLESVTYDESNVPIELLHATYRGDKFRFEVHSGQYICEEDDLTAYETGSLTE